MSCPACGASVRKSATQCPSCGITLFSEPANPRGQAREAGLELIPVLRTEDYGLIPIVRSMFEAEGIDHVVRGAPSQDIFSVLRGAAGSMLPGGPTEIVVRAEDADRARALLHDLRDAELPEDWEPEEE